LLSSPRESKESPVAAGNNDMSKTRPSPFHSHTLQGWLLTLPALCIFLLFYVGPAVLGLWISFFRWDGIAPKMEFYGLANYQRMLQDDRFWNTVQVNLVVLVVSLLVIIPVALLIAIALSRRGFAMKFFRNAIFLPQVLSVATIALVFTLLYDPYQGLINHLLKLAHLGGLQTAWLGEKSTALIAVLLAILWSSLGFHVVLFLAGLAGIPSEYYDAAHLETSSSFDMLRYITVPLLRESIFMSFVVIVGSSFGHATGLIFLLTSGGPLHRTELMELYSYTIAFRGQQYGYSSAISVIVLALVLALVIGPALRLARERLEI
jgi:raffinose/stachyose/melibiose transport system permease protein